MRRQVLCSRRRHTIINKTTKLLKLSAIPKRSKGSNSLRLDGVRRPTVFDAIEEKTHIRKLYVES